MLMITQQFGIEPGELEESFVRASGPGGQNVNKLSSAVQLRFNLAANRSLPEAARLRLARLAGRRLTNDGVIVILAQRHRTQERNRADAMERLAELIRAALVAPVPRTPTRPTLGSKLRRLDAKKGRGQTKAMRGNVATDDH